MESQGLKLTDEMRVDIVLHGTEYGPAPTYGENMYQYRMSRDGWQDSRRDQVLRQRGVIND